MRGSGEGSLSLPNEKKEENGETLWGKKKKGSEKEGRGDMEVVIFGPFRGGRGEFFT